MCPPVVRFLTKILHPNVSRHGDVGIDSIHHNWSLALTISKVLISVQSLLTDPYCQVNLTIRFFNDNNDDKNTTNKRVLSLGMYGARIRGNVYERP